MARYRLLGWVVLPAARESYAWRAQQRMVMMDVLPSTT